MATSPEESGAAKPLLPGLVASFDQELVVDEAEETQAFTSPRAEGILVKKENQSQSQISTHVKSKVKKSTPERIRTHAARLYNEIHDLMDQYNIRKAREKMLSSGHRPSEQVEVEAAPPPKKSQGVYVRMAEGLPAYDKQQEATKGALPNLQQVFLESRQQHLVEAQEGKSTYPWQAKVTEYSSKNPSAFSMRFQTTSDQHM